MKNRKNLLFRITLLTLIVTIFSIASADTVEEITEPAPQENAEWSNPGPVAVTSAVSRATLFINYVDQLDIWWLILLNPDPRDIAPITDAYIELLYPVFILILVLSGFYLIFMSGSPGGRSKAKSMFFKTLITMVLVAFSVDIFKIILNISEALTYKALSVAIVEKVSLTAAQQVDYFLANLILALLILPLYFLSIGIRYTLVLIFAAIFPLTIFLYFFELPFIGSFIGKELAAKLWRMTIATIFSQFVQGIAIAATVIAIKDAVSFNSGLAGFFVSCAGLIIAAVAPLFMSGILQYIGGIVMSFGTVVTHFNPIAGYAITALGGIMIGMGPASLMAAGGVGSMGYAAGQQKTASKWSRAASS